MNWEMFVPVYGTYHTISDIQEDVEQDEMSFIEACSAAVLAGATTAAIGAGYTQILGYNVLTASAAYRNYQVAVGGARLAPLAVPFVVLAAANQAVIRSAPEEQQQGLWKMFSSALGEASFGLPSGSLY